MACIPSSRPKPDCLKPPNGVDTRTDVFELIERTPVSIARTTRIARADVPRPDRAGEPVRRVVGEPDGVRLVGEGNHGGDRAEYLLARDAVVVGRLDERGREPEAVAVRCLATEEQLPSTKDATFSRCAAEISGPISVASSSGSPTRTPFVASTSSSEEAVVAERSTRIRERAQQSWPALPKTA